MHADADMICPNFFFLNFYMKDLLWWSLEQSYLDAANEYTQHVFLAKKNIFF